MSEPGVEPSVLKTHRQACHQAKDAFFSCVTEQGVDFSVGAPVPQPCLEQRKAFEAACRASWVRHFDILRDKEIRLVLRLQSNINKRAATAEGQLAGRAEK